MRRFIQRFSPYLYLLFYIVKKFASQNFIFQNLNFFRFSWHKIWWVCCACMMWLLTLRARLRGPPRYLKHFRKGHKTFSRNTWQKVSTKHMRFCQNVFWPGFERCFMFWSWAETFFKSLQKSFGKSYLTTKDYLQLEISTRNQSHCCEKDFSFETDFQSLREIFQLQVAFCGQIVLSFMNTSKISRRSAYPRSSRQ